MNLQLGDTAPDFSLDSTAGPIHFHDYIDDLRVFVELVSQQRKNPAAPLVLFGHSMGGLITTLLALEWKVSTYQAIVLSSPLFGIAMAVPKLKDHAARLAARWLPSLTLANDLKYSDLTRDETMLKSYETDVLRHDKISPAVYLGMLEGFEKVATELGSLDVPVLMQVAGSDRVVNAEVTQRLFPMLTNKKCVLQIYPESLHEIYNDLDKEQALTDLKKFLSQFAVNS